MASILTIKDFDKEIEKAVRNEEFLKAHQLKEQKKVQFFEIEIIPGIFRGESCDPHPHATAEFNRSD